MRILLTSKDREFSQRARLAFAREGSAVRVADRLGLWSHPDEDAVILHAGNTASAARWCRVTRRVRPTGPLIACCDVIEHGGVEAVLDSGADDVVLTSVSDTELLARVRAVCRRTRADETAPRRGGPIMIDSAQRTVSINGVPVNLRRAEFRLLSYLLANTDRIVGTRELMEDVLGGTHRSDSALIRVHLSQLRRKLGPAGAAIETVRGQGYRLSPEDPELKSA